MQLVLSEVVGVKKFRIGIIILVGVLLLGLILYHLPQSRQVSMQVYTLSGENAQVKMDVKYYRRLFAAPYVKGSVFLDGVEYIDEDSILKTFQNVTNGSESDSGKDSNFPANMVFCKKTASNILEAGNNRIIFFDVSGNDGFEKIHFMLMDESMMDESGGIHGISYFGPAKTAEEAKSIATYFGRPIN